ncbi:hypothetical protein [Nocardia carnea]|uniref:hypothetical protein n=1 Tax=Nocardia carnea TaxID=37328 RepID=UPI000527D1E5|nr:hypothetical protein [Nocardia carnea]
MTTPDWFSHTATAPASACRRVNQHLAAYTRTVGDHARTHLGEDTSICLSGSLARGEPAVRRGRTGYTLGSDVDLVAVVDHLENAEPAVEKFTRALLETHPDIDTTVFTVHRADLGSVAGRFGADLHHAADRPLAGPTPAGVAEPRIGRREGLEGLTHQLATIYCPDSPPAATPWRVKTALEALRAVATVSGLAGGPQRYSDLVDNPLVCTALRPGVVAELVRARERSTRMPITDAIAYDLVITAACYLFDVASTHDDLLAALHSIPDGVHLLDGFQRAVLAATIIGYGPTRFRCAAGSALHVTLTAIEDATVPAGLSSLEALRRISPVEFGRGIDHPNRVLRQHLQGLRRDYYQHLSAHNFGAQPATTYTGPTTATGPTPRRPAHG